MLSVKQLSVITIIFNLIQTRVVSQAGLYGAGSGPNFGESFEPNSELTNIRSSFSVSSSDVVLKTSLGLKTIF